MEKLTEPAGIAALAAGAVALIALILALVLAVRMRRLRNDQRAVLGQSGRDDLVAHAGSLQQAFEALHGRVEEVAERLDERMRAAEERLDGAIAYRSLVRYDAYGELTGHQSTSIALLDAGHNGVVLSSIANRETARLYCKQVHAGEARARALTGGGRGRPPRARRRGRLGHAGDAGEPPARPPSAPAVRRPAARDGVTAGGGRAPRLGLRLAAPLAPATRRLPTAPVRRPARTRAPARHRRGSEEPLGYTAATHGHRRTPTTIGVRAAR